MRCLDSYVELHPKYDAAKELLYVILKHETPSKGLLETIYTPKYTNIMQGIFERFYNSFETNTLRVFNHDAPTEIADVRRIVGLDSQYQLAHGHLCSGVLPDRQLVERYFGQDTEAVLSSFKEFLNANMERDGMIPTVSHHFRIAIVAYHLMMDAAVKQSAATKGALHDTVEDLISTIRKDGKIVYGLRNHQKFLDMYIPEHVQRDIMLLTNYPHMLLKQANKELKRQNLAVNTQTLLEYLRHEYTFSEPFMKGEVEKLVSVLSDTELLSRMRHRDDFVEYLKRVTYPTSIEELFRACAKDNNFVPVDLKALDLSDNGHGKGDLQLDSRLNNLVKRIDFVYYGDCVNQSLPQKNHVLDAKLRELEADALEDSHHVITEKFLIGESRIDHTISALNCILFLRPVLFAGHPSTYYT